jgi:hypothetical protein
MSTTLFAHGPIEEVNAGGPNGADSSRVTFGIRTKDHDVTFFPEIATLPALVARLRTAANLLSLQYQTFEQDKIDEAEDARIDALNADNYDEDIRECEENHGQGSCPSCPNPGDVDVD